MTLTSILIPALIWALQAAVVVALAILVTRAAIRSMDARRKAAEAPFRLLRQQDDVICAMIAETENLVPPELRDRMIKAHDNYREIERGNK